MGGDKFCGLASREFVKFVSKAFAFDCGNGIRVHPWQKFFTSPRLGGSPHPASPPSPHPMRRRESPLPLVIARGQAGFPAEELREMAGVGVAHVERDFPHALLRFAEPPARLIHPAPRSVAGEAERRNQKPKGGTLKIKF
jgi:hypothetical protein